jgi:hypothetical protein
MSLVMPFSSSRSLVENVSVPDEILQVPSRVAMETGFLCFRECHLTHFLFSLIDN